jgi:tRNA(fMet)-specific endonuclease VapC
LLDTDILSDLVRHPHGVVAEQIARVGETAICTSVIVASELRFGAAKRNSIRLRSQLEAVLTAMTVLPFEEPADQRYAELRLHLERAGTPIGPNDMLIAAHALAVDAVLVTANTSEFARVQTLAIENWLNGPLV